MLINCKKCLSDNHDDCKSKSCLCASIKHGQSLKNGVRVDNRFSSPKKEPRNYEKALRNTERLEEIFDDGCGNNSEDYTLREIVRLSIETKHLVSIIDIEKHLREFCLKYNINLASIKDVAKEIVNDADVFPMVKNICEKLGERKQDVVFEKSQITELASYLIGRYHIKRVELTGDLLFFNGMHYEKNAEALIQRSARTCLLKSKNNDMNEIVKYIEQSCVLISTDDIENHVHLKCFLNGIYDVKDGIFSTEFNPDYIILNQIPRNYTEDGNFKKIEKIISEIIPDEKDKQTYKDFGSNCALPYSGIDFQLGCVGIAGTGKSKLAQLLKLSYGKNNVEHASIHSIATDQTLQKDVAYSFLNIDEEMSSDDLSNIESLKKWITQEPFSGRSIYSHKVNFRPTTRLMFCTNGLYEISNPDDSLAIYERTHLIKLSQKFRTTKKEIKNIWDTVDDSEFDEFVSYLVRNATTIYKNNSIKHPQSTEQTESLWNEYGNNIQGFIEEWIIKDLDAKQPSSDIFSKWLSHSIDNHISPKGKQQFYKNFDEIIGSTSGKIRLDADTTTYGYHGFRLRTIDEKSKQEKINITPKGKLLKIINNFESNDPKIKEIMRLLK